MMEWVDKRNSRAEDKRGSLWNLMDHSGSSDQPHQISNNKAPLLARIVRRKSPAYSTTTKIVQYPVTYCSTCRALW